MSALCALDVRTASAAPTGLQSRTLSPAPLSSRRSRTELVYVANYATNSITAYPTTSSGNVRPVIALAGSRTLIVNPVAIAHDIQGRLFVACAPPNNQQGYILIFAPLASGNMAPVRSFVLPKLLLQPPYDPPYVAAVSPESLAVDDNGYTYVGCIAGLLVFAPDARGAAVLLRGLDPGYTLASNVAVDSAGQVYFAYGADRQNPGQLKRLSAFAAGNVFLSGYSIYTFEYPLGLAVAPRSGFVYLIEFNGDPGKYSGSILVFNSRASIVIGIIDFVGSSTGPGQISIAVDEAGQVGLTATAGVSNSVEIYPANAEGNLVPSRTIAGPNTGLSAPDAITFIQPYLCRTERRC